MFKNAEAFNQCLNDWDVNNVLHMSSMFENASAFDIQNALWYVPQIRKIGGFIHHEELERMNNRDRTV